MKKIVWPITAVILFAFFYYLIHTFALSSAAKMRIVTDLGAEQPMKIYYSWDVARDPFSEKRMFGSHWVPKGDRLTHEVYLHNKNVRHVRIDPLLGAGSLTIYSIEITSFFGDTLFWDAGQIVASFASDPATTIELKGGRVELISTGSDPQLLLRSPVKFANPLFGLLLPLFLSIMTTLVIKHIRLREIYAIKDITTKKPSTTHNITALDGLRGFAALLVIADHTGYLYFKGLGATGVWIFFCLSGFLLSIPFVQKPSLITSTDYLQHYMLRRIKRIVPMYYFVLTIVYFFRGNLDSYIRHLTFIQGDGIFWSVPQEMFFYMILPAVFVLNFLVWRGKMRSMLLSTLTLALLLNHYVATDWLYIYGNGQKLSLWLGVFLSGVWLSYFYHSSYGDAFRRQPKIVHDIFGMALLGMVLLSSDGFLDMVFQKDINYSWNAQIFTYIAALLLFFTISNEHGLLGRIMSWFPLRAVGIVGFSFYLLHGGVLRALEAMFLRQTDHKPSHLVLLASGIAITYFLSVITYSLIERPFMRKT